MPSAFKKLGAELIIVFLGVYGAFWVDNWRDDKAKEERTRQVIETLRQDLADQVHVGDLLVRAIDARLGEWEAAKSRGEMPAPYVLRINRSETAPMAAWEAVSRSAVVELLDPGLVFDLGFFYSESEGVGRKFLRYAEFTDAHVMPGLKRGNEWFYDPESGDLTAEFAAHMDRLRDFQSDTRELVAWARCLSDRLTPESGRLESCRPVGGWIP